VERLDRRERRVSRSRPKAARQLDRCDFNADGRSASRNVEAVSHKAASRPTITICRGAPVIRRALGCGAIAGDELAVRRHRRDGPSIASGNRGLRFDQVKIERAG